MSVTEWVHYFSDPLPAGCDDPKSLLGGKGAGLKEMSLAALRVPLGFTISTECCSEYYRLGRRWPDGLEQRVRENLARLEKETGRTFGRSSRPLLVSVRSGAAVSMPGMMDTILNCPLNPDLAADLGDTPDYWDLYKQFVTSFARIVDKLPHESLVDGDSGVADRAKAMAMLDRYCRHTGREFPTQPWDILIRCINAVFESWQSERAVAYRSRNDIRGLPGTAVNVQMMFPSEVSGVLFTQDPNNLSAGQMVIEASYGLGESVVSGDVSPDRFLVSRDDFTNVRSEIGRKASLVRALGSSGSAVRKCDQPSLTPEQIGQLARLAMRVEKHFGHPVDIEWGLADGELALLQARSIRGMDVAREVEPARQEEIRRLEALAGKERRVWVVHNLAQTLRQPTPLTWDLVGYLMGGLTGQGRMYRQLGYRPSRDVCEHGFLELICGRIYADPVRMAGMFWDALPMRYEPEAIAADPSLLERAPTKFDAAKAGSGFLYKLPAVIVGMVRVSRRMAAGRRDAAKIFEQQVLPAYLEYVKVKRQQDLSGLPDGQVIEELKDRARRVLDEFGAESLKPGFFGAIAFDALKAMLAQLMGKDDGNALAGVLCSGLEGETTFEQDELLYHVALKKADMKDFLDRNGHRCVGEMELSRPRWRENHSDLDSLAARLAASGRDPGQIHHQNAERRKAAEKELPETLRQRGGSSFREQVQADLAAAQALLPYRESGKHFLMMGYELLRLATEELAERWDLGGGIYFLRLEELEKFGTDREKLKDQIAVRKLRWQALSRLDPPDVVDSKDLAGLGMPPQLSRADELKGAAAAPGVATGPVRIVMDAAKAGDLGSGYILVCPSTDPGWTPLFMNARGLVVERGGVLSHGAIVARDFGIPAVVCPNATRLLHDGQTVRIDGNTGRVIATEGKAANA
ncbi:MAG: hypothetical protein HZA50_01350 [Planctomycetes bacterium]|nr:hypothetical protein [Planctomycetota bacterium]